MHRDGSGAKRRLTGVLGRRTFVVQGGWAVVAGLGVLAACSPSAPAAPSGATVAPGTAAKPASARVQLPTYVPPKGPAPDVPGSDVIPDGFIGYPKSPSQSVSSPPGDGGEVTVAGETSNPLIPLEQNTLWQQLNKSLNVKLNLNLAPFSDWAF
ncbi:MAG TPA: hypothetical protein VF937_00185, partial [Chloroflexota bacterium]